MEKTEKISDTNIDVTIPVKISYPILDRFLKSKMTGEIIAKENSEGKKFNYAQILNVSIAKSNIEGFDLCLDINLQTLTSLFKNKQVKVFFHASVELHEQEQKISLKDYRIDGETNNWIADQVLEMVINKWMYEKLKRKLNFNFFPHIQEHLEALNKKLENKLEAKEGINLIGSMEDMKLTNFKAGENDLWVSITLQGTGIIELTKLEF
ncbi:DUF4403 family protein [Christiangramia sp.]|uniref:DUF4403 family protein n=1 Tax=Christiangramia sp. TaxID=1931228 RepID=UPI00262C1041|nr:DUF4403 family protein [Christiangramia sp.]